MKIKNPIHIKTDEELNQLAIRIVELIREKEATTETEWIGEQETMVILGISSKTTLGNLRATGKIRYTQPYKRVIRYDKRSVLDFLSKHIKPAFGQ